MSSTGDRWGNVWRWIVDRVVPALVFPGALAVGYYYYIEQPRESGRLEYAWSGGIVGSGQEDKKKCYSYSFKIVNEGQKAVEERQAYMLVEFRRQIVGHTDPETLPVGTRFRHVGDETLGTCIGESSCKVMVGYMISNGYTNLVFSTRGSLLRTPRLMLGGVAQVGHPLQDKDGARGSKTSGNCD